jgi:hypothetical protein
MILLYKPDPMPPIEGNEVTWGQCEDKGWLTPPEIAIWQAYWDQRRARINDDEYWAEQIKTWRLPPTPPSNRRYHAPISER